MTRILRETRELPVLHPHLSWELRARLLEQVPSGWGRITAELTVPAEGLMPDVVGTEFNLSGTQRAFLHVKRTVVACLRIGYEAHLHMYPRGPNERESSDTLCRMLFIGKHARIECECRDRDEGRRYLNPLLASWESFSLIRPSASSANR